MQFHIDTLLEQKMQDKSMGFAGTAIVFDDKITCKEALMEKIQKIKNPATFDKEKDYFYKATANHNSESCLLAMQRFTAMEDLESAALFKFFKCHVMTWVPYPADKKAASHKDKMLHSCQVLKAVSVLEIGV